MKNKNAVDENVVYDSDVRVDSLLVPEQAPGLELEHDPYKFDDLGLLEHLMESEYIMTVDRVEARVPDKKLSALKALMDLSHADKSLDIGKYGPVFAAKPIEAEGTPEEFKLYEAVFGRDSLFVARQLLEAYPDLALSTLKYLSQEQGVDYNVNRDEEPGKIPHEVRDPDSEIAKDLTKEREWGWPYYGSVDATPKFIRLFTAYAEDKDRQENILAQTFTDRARVEQPMFTSLNRAVDWTLGKLSQNPEGLLEYKSAMKYGIENQVWKDSWDAYSHANGAIANHEQGVASVEVQALTYDALLDAADLYKNLGKLSKAEELQSKAVELRTQIYDKFWTEDKGGYFVLGTDRDDEGNLRQLKVRTSNMGHLLNSRILEGDDPVIVQKREAVIKQLFSPEMLNVSGIRTLASDEVRFKPGAYHNGSVWLWDTGYIAQGLRSKGYNLLATELDSRILNAVKETQLLPEFLRGDSGDTPTMNYRIVEVWDSTYDKLNRIEQPPQEIQAWTVSVVRSIKAYQTKVHKGEIQPGEPKKIELEIMSKLNPVYSSTS